MSLSIHFMRHADTAEESPRRFLGNRDIPLSDAGRDRARRWSGALAHVGYTGIFCSPLERCRETAALAAGGLPLAHTLLPGLGEIDLGQWDGLTVAEVKERYPGQYEARGADMAGYRPPGGESFQDLSGRTWEALGAAIASQASTPAATLLVVAHAGVNRVLLCRLLDIPLERLFSLGQDHASLSIVELGSRAPVLRALNLPPPGYSRLYSRILR